MIESQNEITSGDVNQAHLVKLDSLPNDWKHSSVNEISSVVSTNNKKLAKKKYLTKGDFPVIDQGQELVAGFYNDSSLLLDQDAPFIVFGDHTRAFKFVSQKFIPGADGVKVLKINEADPKWAFYAFQAIKLPNKGYARHFQYLKQAYIPLPPPSQQKQIVAKIEELFSHIDAGIESLKTAKEKLKQYRQSVLKAAVTGELTKEWREQNKDNIESADQLLQRILKERRQRWEQQKLAEFQAKGKPPKNDKWKEKYKEANLESIGNFDTIPNTWCWVDMESCAESIDPQPSHRTPAVVDGGIPYIGIGDVNKVKGVINFEDARKVSNDVLLEHIERYSLKDGDFIIGKIGTIGKPFKIPSKRFFALSANVVLVKPFNEIVNSEYLFLLCNSQIAESQFSKGSKATTQAAFGIKKVRLMEIPICSLKEQKEIVRIVEEKLSSADRLMTELDTKLTQAQQQKQTILVSAFNGQLIKI